MWTKLVSLFILLMLWWGPVGPGLTSVALSTIILLVVGVRLAALPTVVTAPVALTTGPSLKKEPLERPKREVVGCVSWFAGTAPPPRVFNWVVPYVCRLRL